MAGSKFDELALQYVLADDKSPEAAAAASEAAALIQDSTNNRILVGQWVASINRWISPDAGNGDRMDDGSGLDEDLISRAKALDFLASTLVVLSRDVLRPDQVKLLAAFFASLFSSDHRAGVTASAKALRQLTTMKAFQPALASDIIENVSKLGDDFKLQTPATRLELYELFRGFLKDPNVVGDLMKRYGESCGFMTGLLELCRSERDPGNLMVWFDILKTFIQSFAMTKDLVEAVFKAFSAYFPISLRASTTPSGITADDLKRAVRACFASHHCLASHAVPFLIGKLDQGDAVTVAVKVDILNTLEACLAQYDQPAKSVAPYMDQVWSSLKYEVRNGEIPDTIEATLKTIAALTRRLDDKNLREFFASAWKDLVDDLSNPTYTAQAGRLLVAISGASVASFDLATSQSIPTIQSTTKNSKSTGHQQDLLTILNSLLLVRSHLEFTDITKAPYASDGFFGDNLFIDIYQRAWVESLQSDSSASEKNGLLGKLMEGMAALVSQRASDDPAKRLCSNASCVQILEYLAKPAIVCPLTNTDLLGSNATAATQDALQQSAATALTRAILKYPEGFQQVLLIFLTTFESTYQSSDISHDLPLSIQLASSTLSEIVCSTTATSATTFTTARDLTYSLLHGLSKVLENRAQLGALTDQLISAFVASIHLNATKSFQALAKDAASSTQNQLITREWFQQFQIVVAASIASPDMRNTNSIQWTGPLLNSVSLYRQLLSFHLLVVRQLYIHFTQVEQQQADDIYLHHLGLLASSVIRSLEEQEQKELSLDKDAFVLFQDTTSADTDASKFNSTHDFRTAPLTMGILQGLHPGAIEYQRHVSALGNLVHILTSADVRVPETTRAALDNALTILSNKLQPKGSERAAKRLEIQKSIIGVYQNISSGSSADQAQSLRIFCSVLFYLAGDVARFQGNPAENELLRLVCEQAPRDPALGRQMAPCFEILVSPKQCLAADNHAIRKRLSDQWIYHQAVQPFLGSCFPQAQDSDDDAAAGGDASAAATAANNRAVATFALLRHMKHEHYAADIAQISRIVIRSLNTLEVGTEMESCLFVLSDILEQDPAALKEHVAALVRGVIAVYTNAIKSAQANKRTGRSSHALNVCRKLALGFLRRVPASYEAPYVVPLRQSLLRPLSLACGDPVREIRRLALAARQAWESLN